MVYRELYLVDGAIATYNFVNHEQAMSWTTGTSNLKFGREHIDELHSPKARNRAFHRWLADAERFRLEWGDIMVPMDIQFAVNDIQQNLGLQPTQYNNTPVQGIPSRG